MLSSKCTPYMAKQTPDYGIVYIIELAYRRVGKNSKVKALQEHVK